MALRWFAKTSVGDFDSRTANFSQVPQESLREFTLYAVMPRGSYEDGSPMMMEYGMSVNLETGKLFIDDSIANMPEIIEAVVEEDGNFKLHYFQRGYSDFNPFTNETSCGIEYAVCGWKGAKKTVFWRFDAINNKIEVNVKDV